MRVVVALGGNALLRRGEPLTVERQRINVRTAVTALAPVACEHELVISHGNGPQVGLLALMSAAYDASEVTPLDVLGAESEGMIGYLLEQELGNVVPVEQEIATILTMTEVDPADPAFADPTKPIGPIYTREEADRLAAAKGWTMRPDGAHYRRVVPSPTPKRIVEIAAIRRLVEQGIIVICAGGGGIPTTFAPGHVDHLIGVEAVIDKDRASALLARELDADLLVMATDADAVYLGYGTRDAQAIEVVTADRLAELSFPAGSMGPKVEAGCDFVSATGGRAAIGALEDLPGLIAGTAGTSVVPGAGRLQLRRLELRAV